MDESARERDIYYRAARIIAYKSRGVRRPPPTIFPILGPISPLFPFPYMPLWSPLGTFVESPLLRRPPLDDTTNNRDFSSVAAQDIATYARTHAYTYRHSMPRLSHGIFCEKRKKKFILPREKERKTEETREPRRCTILFRVARAWKRK